MGVYVLPLRLAWLVGNSHMPNGVDEVEGATDDSSSHRYGEICTFLLLSTFWVPDLRWIWWI